MQTLNYKETHNLEVKEMHMRAGRNYEVKVNARKTNSKWFAELNIIERFQHFNGRDWNKFDKQVISRNFTEFNIENLTIARVLSIINSLEYCESKGLNTTAGSLLLKSLKNQEHKLKFN